MINDKESVDHYRVAVCQFEAIPLEVNRNLAKIEELTNRAAAAGANLVVHPECCVTGMPVSGDLAKKIVGLSEVAFGKDKGHTILQLEQMASACNVHVLVGMPEKVDGRVYNSALHIHPQKGTISAFHKVHMWPGNEEFFAAGDSYQVQAGPKGLFAPIICFDLEFPEASRAAALLGAQLIAVPMANMEPFQEFQRTYARCRAIENSVYMAVSNLIGENQGDFYFGGSIIVDPFGNVLAEAGRSEAVLVADVDLQMIEKASEDTKYLKLRRPDTYSGLIQTTE